MIRCTCRSQNPVPDRGHVRGGVAVPAVALAQDQRQRLPVPAGEAGRERAQRAVADRGDPLGLEFVGHLGQHRVVEALRIHVGVGGERDVEPLVQPAQVHHRLADQHPPDPQRLLIAALQADHAPPGTLHERGIGIELRPRRLVERGEVAGAELRAGGLFADVERVLDEHAELGAPVAQVRRADHVMAEVLQDPDDGVAHDRRPQVADVQFLGDVRAGVVDDDLLDRIGRGDAEPLVGEQAGRLRGDPLIAQREVDEARSAHLGRQAHVGHVQVAGQLGRHLPRRPAQPLAERQRHVGLVVGELRRPDHRIVIGVLGPEGRSKRTAHALPEDLLGIGHAVSLPSHRPWPGGPGADPSVTGPKGSLTQGDHARRSLLARIRRADASCKGPTYRLGPPGRARLHQKY